MSAVHAAIVSGTCLMLLRLRSRETGRSYLKTSGVEEVVAATRQCAQPDESAHRLGDMDPIVIRVQRRQVGQAHDLLGDVFELVVPHVEGLQLV